MSGRLPHGAPRWQAPRGVLAAAFAAGGAAVASLFLVGNVHALFIVFGALVALTCGGAALLGRRPVAAVVVASLPAALVLKFADFAPPPGAAFPIGLHGDLPEDLVGVLVRLLVLVLVFGVAARAAHRARIERSHDALDRVLVVAALWLGVVMMGALAAGALLPGPGLARGKLSSLLPAIAFALGAALAGAALRRDLGRLRFLRAIYEGRAPAWEIVPRGELEAEPERPAPMRYLASCRPDGVLVERAGDTVTVFRSGAAASVAAWVPLDRTAAVRALRRRAALSGVLVALLGAGALAFAGELVAHARPLTGIIAVKVGGGFACALHREGGVSCWGGPSPHPIPVEGVHDAVEIATSLLSTCALRREGEVLCWGGEYGERPKPVSGLPPARRIAMALNMGVRGCALTRSDDVVCWDAGGARGSGVHVASPTSPPDLVVFSSGGCVRGAGGIQCWDAGEADATAQGGPKQCATPSMAQGGAPPVVPGSLTLISTAICETTSLGRVRCWGHHEQGSPRCQAVSEIESIEDARVAVGSVGDGLCVLHRGGTVQCDGWTAPMLEGVVDLASNYSVLASPEVCAVRSDGTVWCWGPSNDGGELGDGTRRASVAPVQVRR